jgi:Flp pilus assembly protein TadB
MGEFVLPSSPEALASTLVLTVLMMIGLFFFIRASVKDRTEQIKLVAVEPIESILDKLQQYFEKRAYRLIQIDKNEQKLTFEGFVQPSLFLAIFLSFLAGVGLFCLAAVLAWLIPAIGQFSLLLVLLTPVAGIFYWKGAGRLERVLLKVEEYRNQQTQENDKNTTELAIAITAHRDEIAQMQQAFTSELFVYDRA